MSSEFIMALEHDARWVSPDVNIIVERREGYHRATLRSVLVDTSAMEGLGASPLEALKVLGWAIVKALRARGHTRTDIETVLQGVEG